MKKITLITAIFLLLTFIVWYSGFFTSIQIQEKNTGPYYLIMIERIGDYDNGSYYIDSIQKALLKDGFNTKKKFGIYFDTPESNVTDINKSIVGVILEDKDTNRLIELIRKDYRVEKYGKTHSVVVEYSSLFGQSIKDNMKKNYPKIISYMTSKRYETVKGFEIYENGKTTYIFEIIKK